MPYVSTVYPAKSALKTLLEAHTFPDTAPTISWGGPTETEDIAFDMVYLGPTEVPENEYVTSPGSPDPGLVEADSRDEACPCSRPVPGVSGPRPR